MSVSDRFCFTIFENHQKIALEQTENWVNNLMASDLIRYLICQKEMCPETKRIHIQGYVEFPKCYKLMASSMVLGGASMRIARGTAEQNNKYCEKKESHIDGPWSFGAPKERPGQGHRTDLDKISKLIHEGKSYEEMCQLATPEFIKHNKGIGEAISIRDATNNFQKFRNRNHRTTKTQLWQYWGVSQAGKSWAAIEECKKKGLSVYIKPEGMWDSYNNEDVVVIDEFDKIVKDYNTFREMLRLIDQYPMEIKVRYKKIIFNSKIVILTGNTDPKTWWNQLNLKEEDQDAWEQRVKLGLTFYFPKRFKDEDENGEAEEVVMITQQQKDLIDEIEKSYKETIEDMAKYLD